VIAIPLMVSTLIGIPTYAFELSEKVLGAPEVPFKVGQTVKPADLVNRKCVETENGLTICPMALDPERGFGIILDKANAGSRVTGVLVFSKCTPETCADALKGRDTYLAGQGEKPA
jgi:hypothetical protein